MPLCVILAALPSPALAQEDALSDRQLTLGGAVAPAILPSGAVAFYGYLGFPELGFGFRQGFGLIEFEARGRFHYPQVGFGVEALAKVRVYDGDDFSVAPYVGLGAVANSGARYLDTANFPYLGIRPLVGAAASYALAETLRAIALLEVPFDVGLVPAGAGGRLNPLVGGGLELYLGEDFTGMVMGRVGLDLLFPPASSPLPRFGFEVRLGLGYRLF
ncbi:MAG: hypothetical protein M3Y59_01530 [Myxococcota bacterium]|nr:hypothetical protein [Myxococcota bacterium]